jgi:hypothetical protein
VARTLGRTGVRRPVLSIGSCYAVDLVETALDEGIVYIPTSPGDGSPVPFDWSTIDRHRARRVR